MILSRSVVTAKRAARLDFLSPERSGVEGEPAPSGRVHDGDLVINLDGQTGSPPSGCSLFHANDGIHGPYLERCAADTLRHNDLPCGPDIGKVI